MCVEVRQQFNQAAWRGGVLPAAVGRRRAWRSNNHFNNSVGYGVRRGVTIYNTSESPSSALAGASGVIIQSILRLSGVGG